MARQPFAASEKTSGSRHPTAFRAVGRRRPAGSVDGGADPGTGFVSSGAEVSARCPARRRIPNRGSRPATVGESARAVAALFLGVEDCPNLCLLRLVGRSESESETGPRRETSERARPGLSAMGR